MEFGTLILLAPMSLAFAGYIASLVAENFLNIWRKYKADTEHDYMLEHINEVQRKMMSDIYDHESRIQKLEDRRLRK